MAEHICVKVGTSTTDKNNLQAYADFRDLPTNTCGTGDGEYLCVEIGTGPTAAIDHFLIATYAEQNDLDVVDSDTPCPS